MLIYIYIHLFIYTPFFVDRNNECVQGLWRKIAYFINATEAITMDQIQLGIVRICRIPFS